MRRLGAIAGLTLALVVLEQPAGAQQAHTQRVVYVSDLSAAGDADDWYDAAVLYSLGWEPTFVLDNPGGVQLSGSGAAAIRELNAITGRRGSAHVGLEAPLRTLTDKGLDQDHQAAVRAILDALRASPRRIPIVAVGSLRDVAAAYNRDPRLVTRKSSTVVVFAGDATAGAPLEPNVLADPKAFVRVLTSGLRVRWVPSFDGGSWVAGVHSSFVQLPQAELVAALPGPYRELLGARGDEPLGNLWAGPLIGVAVRPNVIREGRLVARFVPHTVRFADDGSASSRGTNVGSVELFTVHDRALFADFMHEETIDRVSRLGPGGPDRAAQA